MDTATTIVKKLGGVNVVSELTGFPQQTVSAWICRKPPEIPPWRRSAVAAFVHKAKEPLTNEELAYLTSTERSRKAKVASC